MKLGQRYGNTPNVIAWFVGGDYCVDESTKQDCRDIANGILSVDPDALISFHAGCGCSSIFWAHNEPWLKYHMAYCYTPNPYVHIWQAYQYSAPKPVIEGECTYEGTSNAEAFRNTAWLGMFNGGCGHTYGCEAVWNFSSNWRDGLFYETGTTMPHMYAFFTGNNWTDCTPDNNHEVVIGGYGQWDTYLNGKLNYAPALKANDHSYLYCYMPSVRRDITVNMNWFSSPVTGMWFDPKSGGYQTIGGSPFANTGNRDFHSPSGQDWVLMLAGSTLNVPSNLDAVAIAGQVQLTWQDNSSDPQEDYFIIQRKPYAGVNDWTDIGVASQNTTGYTDTGLLYGLVEYVYRVGAVKE